MAEEVKWNIRTTTTADIVTSEGGGGDDDGDVMSVNEYSVVGFLGEGAFGRVLRVRRRAGGRERDFAVKMLSKSRLSRKRELKRVDGEVKPVTALDQLRRTIEVQRHLYHRHVMLLFEVIDDPDEDKLFMVAEYMAGGEVMWWDNTALTFNFGRPAADGSGAGPMTVSSARRYVWHAALGLQYLHQQGVVHRDIKPDNLLLNDRQQCVLGDLGCAHKFAEEEAKAGIMTDTAGTSPFFSPEVCAGGEYNAYKADVWALGVTLYAFVHGSLPFWAEGGMQPLFDAIQTQELKLPEDSPAHSTPGLNDLLEQMLTKDASKRPSIDEVVDHPWVASYQMEEGDAYDAMVEAAEAAKAKKAAGMAAGGKKEEQ